MGTRAISDKENTLRFINIILSVFSVSLVIYRFMLNSEYKRLSQNLSIYESAVTSHRLKLSIFESFIVLIFYPPFSNIVISGQVLNLLFAYNLNSIVSIFVFFKSYVILRYLCDFSIWNSTFSKVVTNNKHIQLNKIFMIKCYLKRNPLLFIFFTSLFVLIILSFLIRSLEYGIFQPKISELSQLKDINNSNNLSYLPNSAWLMIVTMTTVGYGDFYPRGHFGRFVCFLGCIFGMILISLLIVTLDGFLSFDERQKKAYSIIKKLDADEAVYFKARSFIIKLITARKELKLKKSLKGIPRLSFILIMVVSLKRVARNFQLDYKLAESTSVPLDELLKIQVKTLTNNSTKLNLINQKLDDTFQTFEEIYIGETFIEEKMSKILKLEENISRYLIRVNNKEISLHKKYKKDKALTTLDILKIFN